MDEEELTAERLEELGAQLEKLLQEVDASLAASTQDAQPVDLGLSIGRLSRVDALQQQHMALARRQRVELQRAQVRAALSRLAASEYGLCVKCGESIAYARLRARPEAPFCRECQGND